MIESTIISKNQNNIQISIQKKTKMNGNLTIGQIQSAHRNQHQSNGDGDDSILQQNRDVYVGLNDLKHTLGHLLVPNSTSHSAVSNSITPFNFTTHANQENNIIDSFGCQTSDQLGDRGSSPPMCHQYQPTPIYPMKLMTKKERVVMAKLQQDLEINLKHHKPPKLESFFQKLENQTYEKKSKLFQKRAFNQKNTNTASVQSPEYQLQVQSQITSGGSRENDLNKTYDTIEVSQNHGGVSHSPHVQSLDQNSQNNMQSNFSTMQQQPIDGKVPAATGFTFLTQNMAGFNPAEFYFVSPENYRDLLKPQLNWLDQTCSNQDDEDDYPNNFETPLQAKKIMMYKEQQTERSKQLTQRGQKDADILGNQQQSAANKQLKKKKFSSISSYEENCTQPKSQIETFVLGKKLGANGGPLKDQQPLNQKQNQIQQETIKLQQLLAIKEQMRLENLGFHNQSVQCQTNDTQSHHHQPPQPQKPQKSSQPPAASSQHPKLIEPRKSQIPNQVQITFSEMEGQAGEVKQAQGGGGGKGGTGSRPQSNKNNANKKSGYITKLQRKNSHVNHHHHHQNDKQAASMSPDVGKSSPLKTLQKFRDADRISPSFQATPNLNDGNDLIHITSIKNSLSQKQQNNNTYKSHMNIRQRNLSSDQHSSELPTSYEEQQIQKLMLGSTIKSQTNEENTDFVALQNINNSNLLVSFNMENGGFLQNNNKQMMGGKPQRKIKDLVIETRELQANQQNLQNPTRNGTEEQVNSQQTLNMNNTTTPATVTLGNNNGNQQQQAFGNLSSIERNEITTALINHRSESRGSSTKSGQKRRLNLQNLNNNQIEGGTTTFRNEQSENQLQSPIKNQRQIKMNHSQVLTQQIASVRSDDAKTVIHDMFGTSSEALSSKNHFMVQPSINQINFLKDQQQQIFLQFNSEQEKKQLMEGVAAAKNMHQLNQHQNQQHMMTVPKILQSNQKVILNPFMQSPNGQASFRGGVGNSAAAGGKHLSFFYNDFKLSLLTSPQGSNEALTTAGKNQGEQDFNSLKSTRVGVDGGGGGGVQTKSINQHRLSLNQKKNGPFKFKLQFDKISAENNAMSNKLRAIGAAVHRKNMTTRQSKISKVDTKCSLNKQFSTNGIIELKIPPESQEQNSVKSFNRSKQLTITSSTNYKNKTITNFNGQNNRFKIKLTSNPQTQRRLSRPAFENFNADLFNLCQSPAAATATGLDQKEKLQNANLNETVTSTDNSKISFYKQKKVSIVNIQEYEQRKALKQYATLMPYPLDQRLIEEHQNQLKSNNQKFPFNKKNSFINKKQINCYLNRRNSSNNVNTFQYSKQYSGKEADALKEVTIHGRDSQLQSGRQSRESKRTQQQQFKQNNVNLMGQTDQDIFKIDLNLKNVRQQQNLNQLQVPSLEQLAGDATATHNINEQNSRSFLSSSLDNDKIQGPLFNNQEENKSKNNLLMVQGMLSSDGQMSFQDHQYQHSGKDEDEQMLIKSEIHTFVKTPPLEQLIMQKAQNNTTFQKQQQDKQESPNNNIYPQTLPSSLLKKPKTSGRPTRRQIVLVQEASEQSSSRYWQSSKRATSIQKKLSTRQTQNQSKQSSQNSNERLNLSITNSKNINQQFKNALSDRKSTHANTRHNVVCSLMNVQIPSVNHQYTSPTLSPSLVMSQNSNQFERFSKGVASNNQNESNQNNHGSMSLISGDQRKEVPSSSVNFQNGKTAYKFDKMMHMVARNEQQKMLSQQQTLQISSQYTKRKYFLDNESSIAKPQKATKNEDENQLKMETHANRNVFSAGLIPNQVQLYKKGLQRLKVNKNPLQNGENSREHILSERYGKSNKRKLSFIKSLHMETNYQNPEIQIMDEKIQGQQQSTRKSLKQRRKTEIIQNKDRENMNGKKNRLISGESKIQDEANNATSSEDTSNKESSPASPPPRQMINKLATSPGGISLSNLNYNKFASPINKHGVLDAKKTSLKQAESDVQTIKLVDSTEHRQEDNAASTNLNRSDYNSPRVNVNNSISINPWGASSGAGVIHGATGDRTINSNADNIIVISSQEKLKSKKPVLQHRENQNVTKQSSDHQQQNEGEIETTMEKQSRNTADSLGKRKYGDDGGAGHLTLKSNKQSSSINGPVELQVLNTEQNAEKIKYARNKLENFGVNSLGSDTTTKWIKGICDQSKADAYGEYKLIGFKLDPDAFGGSSFHGGGEPEPSGDGPDSGSQTGRYRREQYRQMMQNRVANMQHSRRLEKIKANQKEVSAGNKDISEFTSTKQEIQAEKSYMRESAELSQSVESPGLRTGGGGGLPQMHSTISNSKGAAEITLDIDNQQQVFKQFEQQNRTSKIRSPMAPRDVSVHTQNPLALNKVATVAMNFQSSSHRSTPTNFSSRGKSHPTQLVRNLAFAKSLKTRKNSNKRMPIQHGKSQNMQYAKITNRFQNILIHGYNQ